MILYQIRLIRHTRMFHLQPLPNISPSPHLPIYLLEKLFGIFVKVDNLVK
ncbi:hypothetical protein [Okeania sp. SIO1I7]|nr:hypothetical protein [Okeania sp. SIO1I7]NET27485.1 hypothetical protein [Okeania sp. SIO1I7]